jgi:hypothetical protein
MSRRKLAAFLGGGAAVAMLPARASTPQAKEAVAAGPTAHPCPANIKISNAVIAGVQAAAVRAYRNVQAGRPNANDLGNMAVAYGILFNHLDEVGATDFFEAQIKARNGRRHSREQVVALLLPMFVQGKIPDAEQAADLVATKAAAGSARADAIFRSRGLHGWYAAAIQDVAVTASMVERNAPQFTRSSNLQGAFIRRVDVCSDFNDVLAALLDSAMADPEEVAELCSFSWCVCAAIGAGALALEVYEALCC